MIPTIAMIFFQGFGYGSKREEIFWTTFVFFIASVIEDAIKGNYALITELEITSLLIAVILSLGLCAVLFGLGFLIGRKWFKKKEVSV